MTRKIKIKKYRESNLIIACSLYACDNMGVHNETIISKIYSKINKNIFFLKNGVAMRPKFVSTF